MAKDIFLINYAVLVKLVFDIWIHQTFVEKVIWLEPNIRWYVKIEESSESSECNKMRRKYPNKA
jgi:hypothetical protein